MTRASPFTFDIEVQDPEAKVVSHIGTNNFQGGQLAGEAVIEALGESGGEIIILDFKAVDPPGTRSGIQRSRPTIQHQPPRRRIENRNRRGAARRRKQRETPSRHRRRSGPILESSASSPSTIPADWAPWPPSKSRPNRTKVSVIAFDGRTRRKTGDRRKNLRRSHPVSRQDRPRDRSLDRIAYLAGEYSPADQPIDSALYRKADADKDPELQ